MLSDNLGNYCWEEIQYCVQFILMDFKVNVGIREIDYCCALTLRLGQSLLPWKIKGQKGRNAY